MFWGERSELRRFQDGSINEAVVWKGGSVGERRGVVTQIIAHLLHRSASHREDTVDKYVRMCAGLL